MRAARCRVRRAGAAAAAPLRRGTSSTPATSPTSTTRSTPPRASRRADRRHHRRATPRPTARTWRARRRRAGRRCRTRPQHIAQIIAMCERLIAGGHAYAAEGHVLFDVASYRRLRQAVRPLDRRNDRRRARRSGAVQEEPGRFRAVEAVDARPARLGQPVGPRPARLAHRMLGDGRGAPGRDDRHPRRRHRPDVPAPRERDRAEHLRARRQGVRALLAAQRHAHLRRPQDVEVARQRAACCTNCCRSIRPKCCAICC